MYAGDDLDILRPEVLHIEPARDVLTLGIPHADEHLRHRGDLKVEHHVGVQPRKALPKPARHHKRQVVEAHAHGALPARDKRDADNVHALVFLAPVFEQSIPLEILPIGVVGYAGEHRYFIPALDPLGAHIVYAERLRVKILADDEYMLFSMRRVGHFTPSVISILSCRVYSLYSPLE